MKPERYSVSLRKGCPACDGVDPKSCCRCGGRTRLSDWWQTETGYAHTVELTREEKAAVDDV